MENNENKHLSEQNESNSAKRLRMPVYPKEKFIEAVKKVVSANAAYVPPFAFFKISW